MVVIEDLILIGGSVLEVVEVVECEGVMVLGVVVIFIYELFKGMVNFVDK